MKMESKNDLKVSWGGSNSPLTCTNHDFFLDNYVHGKEVKIDWFQVTFDFIDVKKNDKFYYELDMNSPLLNELLGLLKRNTNINNLERMPKGQFGYLHGYYVDEFIWLFYGGNQNKREKYPITLTLTGQGCRAFEIMGGNWVKLFQFFRFHGDSFIKVGRLDLAIDDYDGNIITPYQILPYVEQNHVVTQFRTVTLHRGWTLGEASESQGFTLTFGARGSNQLQIYDKRLERDQMDQPDLNTPVWYRYEMRFTDEKALQVMELYTVSVDHDDSQTFMSYAKQLLLTCLDIKEFNPNDDNKRRWNTLPAWKEFTDSLEKIDLRSKNKIDTTIEKKIKWFNSDMATTLLEMYYAYDGDFGNAMYQLMGDSKFKQKHLNRLNAYLRKMGKPEKTLADISFEQNILKEMYVSDGLPQIPYENRTDVCEVLSYVMLTQDINDENKISLSNVNNYFDKYYEDLGRENRRTLELKTKNKDVI